MRQVPLEGDINIAVNGYSGFATSTQKGPFMAMLISHSRGTYLIANFIGINCKRTEDDEVAPLATTNSDLFAHLSSEVATQHNDASISRVELEGMEEGGWKHAHYRYLSRTTDGRMQASAGNNNDARYSMLTLGQRGRDNRHNICASLRSEARVSSSD